MKVRIATIFALFFILSVGLIGQEKALTNTTDSPYAKLHSTNIGDVHWTEGFWAERFAVCRDSMVPHMMGCYLDDEVSHAYKNFEIAAGLETGSHVGPPFHDGDFYKILEAEITVYALTGDEKMGKEIDQIIEMIGKVQREDGYIHTPTAIREKDNPNQKHEFNERLDFETYNMGHLMTAACVHYRTTGKKNLLEIAEKATDYLYNFYLHASDELAQNAICPSHYMGVVEMYRTTHKPSYKELADNLIRIRSLVKDGTDHNQDRIPFNQQTKAVGHAVRANYLYAGVADVYAETGEDSLLIALQHIWNDLTAHKLYVTGACGALYDGVSPNGTSYKPSEIQQVHQAFGSDYELPNLTAHNESCANIGNLLWNWRMLQITGDASYADVMETVMYNALLAGVSLNGKGYFYTNPLRVADELSDDLRWSKTREPYISYCNCCPPNTVRTVAQIQEYAYSISEDGLWVNFYGGNELKITLPNGQIISINQESNYPWDGKIVLTLNEFPEDLQLKLRIPGWAKEADININDQEISESTTSGSYTTLSHSWKSGDKIEIDLKMETVMLEANPLVEENLNQVSVKRGPVVYCIESPDLEEGKSIFDYTLPSDATFTPEPIEIAGSKIMGIKADMVTQTSKDWDNKLYQEVSRDDLQRVKIMLIPYYAWDNRGKSEMSVWIPYSR